MTEKPQMPELIGVSSITTACESMKHYQWAKVLNRREETPALIEGTQLHMLVLEPAKFYQIYVTDLDIPADKLVLKTVEHLKLFLDTVGMVSTKGKKEELIKLAHEIIQKNKLDVLIYDKWLAEQTEGKEFISKVKWTALHEMKESILNHAFARKYLDGAKKEFPIEGVIDGQKFRGRVDWLNDDPKWPYVICVDVKKTKSAKFYKFRQQITDNWYFVQAALYTKLLEQMYGRPVLYVWMAVEGTWPYIAEAYSGNEAMIEAGMVHVTDVMKRLRTCFETDTWPGYSAGLVCNIDLPNFAYDQAAELESTHDLDDNDGHEEI